MNPTVTMPTTIPITDNLWRRARCALKLHSYGRWQVATLLYAKGYKRAARVRDCTTCGWLQIRPL